MFVGLSGFNSGTHDMMLQGAKSKQVWIWHLKIRDPQRAPEIAMVDTCNCSLGLYSN